MEMIESREEKMEFSLSDLKSLPKNLIIAMVATFFMRSSFYLTLAVLNHPDFLKGVEPLLLSIIFVAYPLAELLTVSFFGALTDKIGRRSVFLGSYVITIIAILLIAFFHSNPVIIPLFTALFGIGAAAKVSSTLALVADESDPHTRGRNMGLYDMATLIGLGTGFGGGFLLMEFYNASYGMYYLLIAAGVLTITLLVTVPLLKESKKATPATSQSLISQMQEVFKNPHMRKLLPIWIPIICLYGIILNFAEHLAAQIGLDQIGIIFVLGIAFGSIVIAFPVQGVLSDRYGRKPFLYIGMFSFAAFVTILTLTADNPQELILFSPLLVIVGLGAGAFAPAALALLADISKEESYGTAMGAYSVIYGIGLIVGPLVGAVALQLASVIGLILVIWLFAAISIVGTYLLPIEFARPQPQKPVSDVVASSPGSK